MKRASAAWLVGAALIGSIGCSDSADTTPDLGIADLGIADLSVCPELDIEGMCMRAMTNEPATRTACGQSQVNEFCDPAGHLPPNLACLASIAPRPLDGGVSQGDGGMVVSTPTGPTAVILTGFVHGSPTAPDTQNLSVAVFASAPLLSGTTLPNAAPLGQITNLQLDGRTKRACDVDVRIGCSIPPRDDCPDCSVGLDDQGADNNHYCRQASGGAVMCSPRLRWESRYTLPNIATNRQLTIRVTGPNGRPDATWANALTWNVFLSSTARACTSLNDSGCLDLKAKDGPTYQLDVTALARNDFLNQPVQAGTSMQTHLSSVYGEVRDCDDVRLANVSVEVAPAEGRLEYYQNIDGIPNPSSALVATSALGQFAAFNLPANFGLVPPKAALAKVVAAGKLTTDGLLVSFGAFDLVLFPDSAAILTVNSGHPR